MTSEMGSNEKHCTADLGTMIHFVMAGALDDLDLPEDDDPDPEKVTIKELVQWASDRGKHLAIVVHPGRANRGPLPPCIFRDVWVAAGSPRDGWALEDAVRRIIAGAPGKADGVHGTIQIPAEAMEGDTIDWSKVEKQDPMYQWPGPPPPPTREG